MTIGVLQAIIVAVVLSVADILRRAARPADAVLGWSAQEDRHVNVVDDPDAGVTPGVVVYRIQTGCSSQTPTSSSAGLGGRGRRPQARATRGPRRLVHQCHRRECEAALREVIDGLRERNIEIHVVPGQPLSFGETWTSSVWSRPSAPTTSTAP